MTTNGDRQSLVTNLAEILSADPTDDTYGQIEAMARILAVSWIVHEGGDPFDGRWVDRLTNIVMLALDGQR